MYVELADGAIQNRGRVVSATLLDDLGWNARGEMYNSYYQFDEELIDHFKIRKTIKGYKGKYYLANPMIDIDKGVNSDEFVLERTKVFIERLWEDFHIDQESCQFYFSGRGYHITLPDIFHLKPSNTLPSLVKNTMLKYFPEGDDIYDGARLFRTPYSKNSKSGLYKIPITTDELFNLKWDDIHRLATERRKVPAEVFADSIPDLSELVTTEDIGLPVNEVQETTNIATCIQKMYYEGPVEGTRHEKLLRMVTSWRRSGIPREGIIAMAQHWAQNLEKYEVVRLVNDIYDKGYHPYKCTDRVMTKYCDQKCIFYKSKNYTTDVINSSEAEKTFIEFVNSNLEERAFDFNEIWRCASYKFYPGEAIAVVGDTKLGKSTLVQNICVALKTRKILYLPLENTQNLAFRRFMQMTHNMSKEEVYDYYKKNKNDLSRSISHIHMVSLPPTVQGLRKIMIEHKPDIVVIDTLDGLDVPNVYDDTAKTYILGNELKNMAQQLDTIVFAVAHISKSAAIDMNGKPKILNIHSPKGSSAISQKFDKILAWEGERNSIQRILTSLGARDEESIRLAFNFNYVTFRMEQLGV